ncbi:phosphoesterase family-domain-containing protein [Suillus subaureus]|uniref:Phosphoesterase family-domain-containing protein n=1 Tax=Suillus subaureus TaxID=48587 RepID=A0A9P7ELF0_9AGAM|nr:phosphoesterase family-domain-containing protein [Suillus subaureus]KAG1825494.1 phosphoesterase family-domain-containing protein [Suillus subaureus]
MIVPSIFALAAFAKTASAAAAASTGFTAPAPAPTSESPFYVGPANNTITNTPIVPGKVFDRFIQIWLENTDFDSAASQPVFQSLAAEGITLTGYYGVTHPSEPNYLAAVGGDFFGLAEDSLEYIPTNMSTVVDLLDQKNISWATYQENMPTDAYEGYNFTNSDNYTYYVRKHNPLVIYESVANISTRAARIRNFNDFAVDVGNDSLSQWIFITPNLRDDGHDTTVGYAASWLTYWLLPLLNDTSFNTNSTLILLTFDENETYTIGNNVFSILLGGVIPAAMKNTTDPTFYTHYSTLSTVENNWDLGNLGRQDTNKTVANVFEIVANITSYQNNNLTGSSASLPQLNITGTIPGTVEP